MATADLIPSAPGFEVARVESLPFGEHSYICRRAGGTDCVVVDPGFEPEAIVEWIESHELVPRAILLTHGHSDHIAGNGFLKARWPDLPILVGRAEAGKLVDPVANLSAPFGLALTSPPADRLLDDGERFAEAGLDFEVRAIPGHSSGHVVFLLEGSSPPLVFGGDVLFREGIGRTDFPDGDFAALAAGIRSRLYTLPPEAVVYPGHGEPTTVGHERRHNPFVPATAD
ncbi:MAG: hypothetical protein RLZZ440_696 [Planctomycetota bacterium]